MATNLAIERAKLQRWRLRPQWASVKWFDQLAIREFLPPEEQLARQNLALQAMVRWAALKVPYYRDCFASGGLAPGDIQTVADLVHLPILTRGLLQANQQALEADELPPGQQLDGKTKTSGTTGQPVFVTHTGHSKFMFNLLKQRELRWANCDPLGLSSAIYGPTDLPRLPDGNLVGPGRTIRLNHWPHVGNYFHTGAFIGLSNVSSISQQVSWLEEHRPHNLVALPSNLEHLALAFQERPRLESLRGLRGISQQLTPAMRRTISQVFKVPVDQNYGLNEIGIVASRCRVGDRFHVHAEHCLVEIVDGQGQPSPPGKFGRLLVTGLANAAMPLFRYDSDDLAMAVAGPCPCGRTLPSFGAIQGRYRRVAWLPAGVWNHWGAFLLALEEMPLDLLLPLRQYQMHHHADGRFVLRLVATGPLAEIFFTRVRSGWKIADEECPFPLEIRLVDSIPDQEGSKFQDFTSDLAPPPDWEPPPPPWN